VRSSALPNFPYQTSKSKQMCHPDRSEAKGPAVPRTSLGNVFRPHFNCIALCSAQSRISRQNSSMRFRSVSHEHINRAAPPINV
jgi:hypothetical protein